MSRSYFNSKSNNTSLTPAKTKSQPRSLLNLLIQQQTQAIQSQRQLSIERHLKTSPIETSPHIKKVVAYQPTRISTQSTQFDRLLNENTQLLMRIQELEQKNSLLQMKCKCSENSSNLEKSQKVNNEPQYPLKELINRQQNIMHIPSVLQTLSLVK